MDLLTEALAKMNLSQEFYFGEDLSNELSFLEDAQKELEKNLIKWLYNFIMKGKS